MLRWFGVQRSLETNALRDFEIYYQRMVYVILYYSQSSKYNQKVIDVIFLDKLYQDINSSVDELWDMVPPSLRSSHTGSKEDLLRQLGLL